MKYEIWKLESGSWVLVSSHRLKRVAKSRFDSYVRQGKGSFELRKA